MHIDYDSYFPINYKESRQEFIENINSIKQLHGINTQLWHYPLHDQKLSPSVLTPPQIKSQHPLDDLSIDIAYIGPKNASHILCISSGTHGVEGFLGAALQHTVLDQIKNEGQHHITQQKNQALLCIHALNPYGFNYLRRVNEQNIDLNRNFLLESQKYQGAHPFYQKLDHFLNPSTPPQSSWKFYIKALSTIAHYGLTPITQAIAQGQYQYPQGLFFGGYTMSRSALIIQKNLTVWLQNARHVIHIDIHTGLGKSGEYMLAGAWDYSIEALEKVAPYFQPQRIENLKSKSTLYQIQGEFMNYCRYLVSQHDSKINYLPFLLECGSYNSLKVLQALRQENACTHYLEVTDKQLQKARLNLKEHFIPQSTQWKNQTLANVLAVTQQACQVLQTHFI